METSILSRFSVTSLSLVYLWTDWTWGGALPPPELPQFQLGGQMPHKTPQCKYTTFQKKIALPCITTLCSVYGHLVLN